MSPRRPLRDVPSIVGVTLRSQPVKVIDVSAGGVLIECDVRLLPGETSALEIVHADGARRMGGRVVRSEVARISGRVLAYRIAFAFDASLDFIDQALVTSGPSDLFAGAPDLFLAVDPDTAEQWVEQHFDVNAW